MHVHAVKGDAECKYWIDPDGFDITEEFEYNCTPRSRREVRQIIFEHFDQIGEATPERGGRAKRYFQVTAHGLEKVRESQRALCNMWDGLSLEAVR